MKPWQLSKRVNNLSEMFNELPKTDTTIDWNCLTEPERQLLNKVEEIIDQYAPNRPPKDIIEKYADLWYKGLEIFGSRVTELFVEVIPDTMCCDELEAWYFKLYFYNFWRDWIDSLKELRDMPKEQHETLLRERKEMGMLDVVFRLPKTQPNTIESKGVPK